MCAELTATSRSALVAEKPLSTSVAVTLAETLVDPHVGPIIDYQSVTHSGFEEGHVHQYVTNMQETTRFSMFGNANPQTTAGSSLDEADARIAALGEAIERYCLSIVSESQLEESTYGALDEPAVHPLRFHAYGTQSEQQLSAESAATASYYWTPTRTLRTGEQKLVPAQTVFLPFAPELRLRNPSSTGAAVHTSPREAVIAAIAEVVERECFAIGYLNRLRFPAIELSEAASPGLEMYRSILERQGVALQLLDISLDQPFTTVLALGVGSPSGRTVDVGLGTASTRHEAARGALRELLQISHWHVDDSPTSESIRPITSLEDRARFWADTKPAALDFWLDDTRDTVELCDSSVQQATGLDAIEDWLDTAGLECCIADITTPDIADAGFTAVKAVIPGAHPLHLLEPYRYLGSDRLFEVPVDDGFLAHSRSVSEMAATPHPFL